MDYLIKIFNEPSNIKQLVKVEAMKELVEDVDAPLLPRRKIDNREMWFLTRILVWVDKYRLVGKIFKIRNTDFVVSAELLEDIVERGYYNEAEKLYLETLIPLYFNVVHPTLSVDELKEEFDLK